METTLIDWLHQLGTLEFWEALLEGFEGLGPLVPILLAMVESIFPPLPLIAIVALNIAGPRRISWLRLSWLRCGRRRHGGVPVLAAGGQALFLEAGLARTAEKAQQWVSHVDTATLFMLAVLPFTPTSFLHLAFGISDFDEKRYLLTLLAGKAVMVAMMALFGQSLVSALKNPVYLILAIAIWAGMYWVSRKFCKKHDLDR